MPGIKQVSSSPTAITIPLPPADASDASDAHLEAAQAPADVSSAPLLSSPLSTSPPQSPATSPVSASPTSRVHLSDNHGHEKPESRRQATTSSNNTTITTATTATRSTQDSRATHKDSSLSVSSISDGFRNIIHETRDMLVKLVRSSTIPTTTATDTGGTPAVKPGMIDRTKTLNKSFKVNIPCPFSSSGKLISVAAIYSGIFKKDYFGIYTGCEACSASALTKEDVLLRFATRLVMYNCMKSATHVRPFVPSYSLSIGHYSNSSNHIVVFLQAARVRMRDIVMFCQ